MKLELKEKFIIKVIRVFTRNYPFTYNDFHYLYYQIEKSFDFLVQTADYALKYNISILEAARKVRTIKFAERNNIL